MVYVYISHINAILINKYGYFNKFIYISVYYISYLYIYVLSIYLYIIYIYMYYFSMESAEKWLLYVVFHADFQIYRWFFFLFNN